METTRHEDEAGVVHLTLSIAPEDDPEGWLRGLWAPTRISQWARMLAGARPADETDAYWLLNDGGRTAESSLRQLEAVVLHCRQQLGMSYGDIATALDRPRSSVQAMIRRLERGQLSNADDAPAEEETR